MMSVLIIEDNETMREGMAQILKKMNLQVDTAANGRTGVEAFRKKPADVVITDYRMDGLDGMQVLQAVKARAPQTLMLMITAYGSIELAVEAMQNGAADFITKPFSMQEFRIKIENLLDRLQRDRQLAQLEDENEYLRQEIDSQFNFGDIIGDSPPMHSLYALIEKVARTESTVLLSGESGTGKELVARAIHKSGCRKEKPFVRVNCGALTESLIESELFGHEKGAFTHAIKRKRGRFELADGGTIFLDEISELPLSAQVKLLRILQEGEFERVGGEETLKADVRVIAATNQELQSRVNDGRFREDLFFRLNIIPLALPPLRQRTEDIPVLAEHFLGRISSRLGRTELYFSPEALAAMQAYPWPGNVRELENVVERAAVLADDDCISPEQIPLAPSISGNGFLNGDLNSILAKVEKETLMRALQASKNKSDAARRLGLTPSALHYKLEKYGLE